MEQIKETEIMIGNYFLYDNKIVFIAEILKSKLVTIYDGSGLEKGTTLECLRPIPLTEDVLLKYGSVFHDEECHIPCLYGDIVIEKYENLWFFTAGEGCKLSQGFYSLHQLQNLFKALTQTDLKVEV